MPTGKLINPDGPGAKPTIGTVEDINGVKYSFFNNAKIKKDEPVMFDVETFQIKMNGNWESAEIAILEQDNDGKPLIAENPWPDKFKKKWDSDWEKEDPEDIYRLNIKNRHVDKNELLTYDKNNQGTIEK